MGKEMQLELMAKMWPIKEPVSPTYGINTFSKIRKYHISIFFSLLAFSSDRNFHLYLHISSVWNERRQKQISRPSQYGKMLIWKFFANEFNLQCAFCITWYASCALLFFTFHAHLPKYIIFYTYLNSPWAFRE